MAAMWPFQTLPGGLGLDLGTAGTIIGAILVILGLALAFFGRSIWSTVMAIIGAFLGGAVGFIAGFAIAGSPLDLVLAAVGAVLGGFLFGKLVKVALAFVVALLAAALVYILLGGPASFQGGALNTALIASLLTLIGVFAVSYYFIEELLGVITAIIGGLLLAGGLYLLLGPGSGTTALLAGLGVLALGGALQTLAMRKKKRAAAAASADPFPPPPPP